MKYILSAEEMRSADSRTSEVMHVSNAVLMERAALLTAERVSKRIGKKRNKVLIVCGPGNNGGDGFACGRILLEKGIETEFLYIGDEGKMSPLEHEQFLSVKALKEEAVFMGSLPVMDHDIIVDAIFGISLSRNVEGDYADIIGKINEARKTGAFVISIDIPSGIEADSGQVMGIAVEADETLVCGFYKYGNLLHPGTRYSGKLILGDIGITEKSLEGTPKFSCLEKNDICLPDRTEDSNKGSYGKVLLFAGSSDIAGAACLAGKAALKSGCGMVRVLTHEKNRGVLQSFCPELLVSTYRDKGEEKASAEQLSLFDSVNVPEESMAKALSWCSVIAAGPGIGTDSQAEERLKYILKNAENRPVVLDADALNIIAGNMDLLTDCSSEIVITPHLMEMSRLTGIPVAEIKSHLTSVASDFATGYHVITVLKDSRTVTALPDGRVIINTNGNNGMATACSGDVLTGIIAALIAQGLPPEKAAYLGVSIHGAAGDRAYEKTGAHGMMATDIIENIR